MKVLIVGAGGQVGRTLLEAAPASLEVMGLTHHELDITDEKSASERLSREEPDLIINAAAYTAVDRAESEPEAARRANVDGPRHLAIVARAIGARLLHISTDFVFDGASSVPYRADAVTNPLNVYGRTKLAGEHEVMQTLRERSVILRTGWLHAAHGNNFVRTMLRLMSMNGSVSVVADQIGTPTAVDSLADVIWKLTQRPDMNGIYHWSDAGVASWYDFAIAIAEEAAAIGLLRRDVAVSPIATKNYPTPARRPRYSVLDKSELLAAGFVPFYWRSALRAVLGKMARDG